LHNDIVLHEKINQSGTYMGYVWENPKISKSLGGTPFIVTKTSSAA
jgi:hypothetical protein